MNMPNDLERNIVQQGVAVAAVLQLKNEPPRLRKSVYIYNIYIDIEVIFEGGNVVQRTAALQQLQHMKKKIKKVRKTFVNRNQIFVPLHRRNERSRGRLLIDKIARIKSRNCAH